MAYILKEALERTFLAGQWPLFTPVLWVFTLPWPLSNPLPHSSTQHSLQWCLNYLHIWLTFLAWAVCFVYPFSLGKTRLEFFKGILLMCQGFIYFFYYVIETHWGELTQTRMYNRDIEMNCRIQKQACGPVSAAVQNQVSTCRVLSCPLCSLYLPCFSLCEPTLHWAESVTAESPPTYWLQPERGSIPREGLRFVWCPLVDGLTLAGWVGASQAVSKSPFCF